MIFVENKQSKIDITEEQIQGLKNTIDFALKEEEVTVECQISLVFVDNEEIRKINRKNRNIDRETDVLSFPMLDYDLKKVYKQCYKNFKFDKTYLDGEELVLGDIVLSLEKALEQSSEYSHSFEREASYLVVHSMLHLLGYDHIEDDDKSRMREREEYILNLLKIRRG